MSALLDALLGMGSGVLDVLDMPGSYLRGVLGGKFGDRLSGREMLDEWGVTDENTPGLDFGDIAGFGAEMIADPLNWIGGAGIARKLAGIGKHNKASQAMRAAGAMPEEIAGLTKAVDEAGQPLRVLHGTRKVFDEYDPQLFNQSYKGHFGPGVYTTPDPKIASKFAGDNPGANVRMHYVDSRNPLDLEASYRVPVSGEFNPSDLARIAVESGQRLEKTANQSLPHVMGRDILREMPEIRRDEDLSRLLQMGFDAISDPSDLIGNPTSKTWFVPDPKQVYLPYIAPALRSSGETAPLLAALLGYNTLNAMN